MGKGRILREKAKREVINYIIEKREDILQKVCDSIASKVNCSPATVYLAVRELVNEGILKERKVKTSNRFIKVVYI